MHESVPLAAVVGYVIQTERKARRLTQAQLALHAGMHSVALSKIERGIQRDIGVVTLHNLAEALSQWPPKVTASSIIDHALEVQAELMYEIESGTLPVHQQSTPVEQSSSGAGAVLAGAALAAFVAWLATHRK